MKKLLTILLVLGSLTVFSQGTNMYKMKRLKTDTLYLLKADSSISSTWLLVWDSTTNKIGAKRGVTAESDPVWLSVRDNYKRTWSDTTGVGSTANIGVIVYYTGHFYGLKAGEPPTWVQLDN